jgi:hypothetical protein
VQSKAAASGVSCAYSDWRYCLTFQHAMHIVKLPVEMFHSLAILDTTASLPPQRRAPHEAASLDISFASHIFMPAHLSFYISDMPKLLLIFKCIKLNQSCIINYQLMVTMGIKLTYWVSLSLSLPEFIINTNRFL